VVVVGATVDDVGVTFEGATVVERLIVVVVFTSVVVDPTVVLGAFTVAVVPTVVVGATVVVVVDVVVVDVEVVVVVGTTSGWAVQLTPSVEIATRFPLPEFATATNVLLPKATDSHALAGIPVPRDHVDPFDE
jgi:hypothetical protein